LTGFDRLHPALQHHIVNSLGWRELRPFQEQVIPSILEGKHLIILAPTAGGKTEAAFFPILSRMMNDEWPALSVLYICPIKALLNNLDIRLQRYCTLVGRRSALWHGDVNTSSRRKILRDPPDCLLTTPESLEVMLVSPNVDSRGLFCNLKAVIVDEIHAFAGDDRGWHLLAVLERVSRLAGRELQRLGLSATVGNPETLVNWLAGSCAGPRDVFMPAQSGGGEADVQLDYVASLENAAIVISRLHRGEKRLVFVDSRARAEQLGAELRQRQVSTFVTHSSLSQEQRHQAEEAFASRDDCVIVATSVLELGIDVGDLDRVIQIDAPPTVSSFLQRMGRTGRRAGTPRNCLFLATRDDALIQAAGLIDLWAEGYVEPITPPTEPYHVLAQQLMALVLQQRGIGRHTWLEWVGRVPAFDQMPVTRIQEVTAWMLQQSILWEEEGILGIGHKGEEVYGRRHFLELLSVFLSPPLFAVLHGRQEVGYVDELTFVGKREGDRVLLLGGRAWRVTHIDWQRKVAYVEASQARGRSRWKGVGQGLSFRLCQAIKLVLAADDTRSCWSQRARTQIEAVRTQFPWIAPEASTVIAGPDSGTTWWTFAGQKANAALAPALAAITQVPTTSDSLSIDFDRPPPPDTLQQAVEELRSRDPATLLPDVDDEALEAIKFFKCLPRSLALHVLGMRRRDPPAVQHLLGHPIRFVSI